MLPFGLTITTFCIPHPVLFSADYLLSYNSSTCCSENSPIIILIILWLLALTVTILNSDHAHIYTYTQFFLPGMPWPQLPTWQNATCLQGSSFFKDISSWDAFFCFGFFLLSTLKFAPMSVAFTTLIWLFICLFLVIPSANTHYSYFELSKVSMRLLNTERMWGEEKVKRKGTVSQL